MAVDCIQPPKPFQAEYEGSIPFTRSNNINQFFGLLQLRRPRVCLRVTGWVTETLIYSPPKDGVIGRPGLWIAEDFRVLRFRLMVKRGPW
jgi:hypothetical protein